MAGAALRDILGDSRSANVVFYLYFTIQNRLQDGIGKVKKAAGAR